jgi:subtilisin family serine protease
MLVPLPDALDGRAFPGEALGCAVNVFRRSGIRAGQTVAVVDSGMLATHQDLAASVWTNPGESAPNARPSVDDDGDGLKDDIHGWNYVAGTNDPTDLEGHGTHVTGILAAAQNNRVGVTGIAPDAKVFSLRVLSGPKLTGTDADIAAAFDLAGRLHIPIVNASIQEPTFSQAIADAIAAHRDTLYVVAAGNATAPAAGADNDVAPTYPCALPETNVICVGASDANDRPAGFSNFGRTSVDLFAPGVNIDSAYISSLCGATTPTCYAAEDGTSMAAPFVSGTLALMRASNPSLTAAQLKDRLLGSVAHPAALAGKSVTGGRLDAAAAVAAAARAAQRTAGNAAGRPQLPASSAKEIVKRSPFLPGTAALLPAVPLATTAPAASRIGETVSETATLLPSARMRSVS